MKRKIFEDFVTEMPAPKEIIEKYRGKLPAELIEAWEQYGFGTFLNGYLKMVNPDEYQELLCDGYVRGKKAIPIFVTAFADVITWEESKMVGIVYFKYGLYDLILPSFDLFWSELENKEFIEAFFELDAYKNAVDRWGKLPYEKCFCYVPILALGGSETTENLDIGDTRVHIDIIIQLTGMVKNYFGN